MINVYGVELWILIPLLLMGFAVWAEGVYLAWKEVKKRKEREKRAYLEFKRQMAMLRHASSPRSEKAYQEVEEKIRELQAKSG